MYLEPAKVVLARISLYKALGGGWSCDEPCWTEEVPPPDPVVEPSEPDASESLLPPPVVVEQPIVETAGQLPTPHRLPEVYEHVFQAKSGDS